ncbi:hypothetical protein QAD02_014245 [Eretmocerus hayati]|uniref:Uncharacterized protein n=1 Tax=Eretmocerus hayati TaxID=131215 RepID=A0ACC2P4R8_9HYME|nr:hypothetical protein QAD02_014245 [Eretmocerus hayati]
MSCRLHKSDGPRYTSPKLVPDLSWCDVVQVPWVCQATTRQSQTGPRPVLVRCRPGPDGLAGDATPRQSQTSPGPVLVRYCADLMGVSSHVAPVPKWSRTGLGAMSCRARGIGTRRCGSPKLVPDRSWCDIVQIPWEYRATLRQSVTGPGPVLVRCRANPTRVSGNDVPVPK